MPRASSRSSERLVWSSSCARSSRLARSGSPPGARARGAQEQREPDEPRLRAVVEVALEAPALGVADLDEPRARRPQLLEAPVQLGVQARDVRAQEPAEEGERHQRGRHEGRPPRHVARAGHRDDDEQEGEQRAGVDGRELQPGERRRALPVARGADHHHDEQADVEQRAHDAPGQRQRLVVADEQDVVRAVGAVQRLGRRPNSSQGRKLSGKIR